MYFANARCAMVRNKRRRQPLHQVAAACSRCRNFILGFGVDDRLGLTQRRIGRLLCAASSQCRVRSLGCGTQGGALPAVSAAGLVCVRLVHAAARRGALPGRRPFLCAGADGQDHGHLAAGRTAAARLLAAAKIFCGCECAPEILTDVVHAGRRKNPLLLLAIAGGAMTLYMHGKEGALTAAMPLSWRLKNVIYSYLAYVGKAYWPTRQAVFYPHPENSLPSWKVIAAGVLLLGISGIVWRLRARRYLTVGWLWYLGT